MPLTQLLPLIWARLAGAGAPSRAAFGLLQAATIDPDGAPDVRTVVLREVSAADHRIRFYSDNRSPKIGALQRDPRIALVGYDAETRTQLRMKGRATLAPDAARRQAWETLADHALIDYQGRVPPGTSIDQPGDAAPQAHTADNASAPLGYAHFCIVDVTLDCVDWLDLSDRNLHARARFERDGTTWQGGWIAP
ncbi:pyridoxamine 5'-phosphate oxidase family protein [Robbsia sp. KACC 23696]|uniref:pyridoxamine 5'-phosphate oxidase family protein n=1 Tax=Robbsia sp. KACC 23696 TaxID=3149231 RepID=UPI00325B1503